MRGGLPRRSAWPTTKPTPIPLVLLFPEVAFDEAKFLAAVDAKVKAFGYCCVGVSEGLLGAGRQVAGGSRHARRVRPRPAGRRRAVGSSIVKDKLNYKYHWAVADYLQRAARHLARRPTSSKGLRGRQGGGRAGAHGKERGHADHHADLRQALPLEDHRGPLAEVANVEKMLPKRLHHPTTATISPRSARAYLAPLIHGEAPPPFKDGLPAVRQPQECRGRERSSRPSSRCERCRQGAGDRLCDRSIAAAGATCPQFDHCLDGALDRGALST